MTKTIALKNITQAFFERVVLDDVSFKCTDQDKICIVGENGTGKSTLLKLIASTAKPTEGNIEKQGHIRCHYIAQEFAATDMDMTIEAYITKYAGPSLFKKVFTNGNTLGFDLEKSKTKECRSLSGGQQKILALSVGLATSPDFLLLDEPENHLDVVSRLELVELLATYRGGVLFVSHDRMIIDAVADKVVEITGKKLYVTEGGYEAYVEHRLSRIASAQREYDKEAKRIRQLSENMTILKQKAFRGKNVAQYHKRLAEMSELKEKHRENDRPEDKKTMITLKNQGSGFHGGKLLCRIKDLHFRYQHAKSDILLGIDLEMRSGSHIVLLGRNGSGKSTFLKCLTGSILPTKGEITWADGIKTAYFDQHAEFKSSHTALEAISDALACPDERARTILGMMKFSSDKMTERIENLSGGERMRIRFGVVFGANPDFIILDEPTNHLDEVTWEILLDACNRSKSMILLVTHDYEFISELTHKTFWLLKKQSITERHKELVELIEELR
ncbi:MAG: ATP-binding cassette domain-containing protein [Candidatus Pacebacteria bacterium]|jgi:ATPase subunit of ABC transporter with duplicated ATPase domains|nr:ATP-binding cassette domain-containing protein [Candidatus Paceibacterota bacterium]